MGKIGRWKTVGAAEAAPPGETNATGLEGNTGEAATVGAAAGGKVEKPESAGKLAAEAGAAKGAAKKAEAAEVAAAALTAGEAAAEEKTA